MIFSFKISKLTVTWLLMVASFAHGSDLLIPKNASQFLVVPDTDSTLIWKLLKPIPQSSIKCRVDNYEGKQHEELQASIENGTAILKLKLPKGFYTVNFSDYTQTFGILVADRYERSPDPFFGIDAALSVLQEHPEREESIRILKWIGVTISRERLLWNKIEPEQKRWDWNAQGNFEEARKIYKNYDIGVLELFHFSPAWLQSDPPSPFPRDLLLTTESWQAISERFGQYWQGLEVWNEADIPAGQGGAQAEQYVPVVKAVAYGVRNSTRPAPIGGGVFAYLTKPYMELAAENGLLDVSDFLSFHYYSEPFSLESYIAEYRQFLEKYGYARMPLWLTECGSPWFGSPNKRPPLPLDQKTGLRFAELAIEARACGIARYFPFVLVKYAEYETKNFGMLDKSGSPLRSMAAYTQCISALANVVYVGDLPMSDPSKKCRAFLHPDDRLVLVFMNREALPFEVSIPFSVERLEGIDGRVLPLESDGRVKIPDGLGYAVAKFREVKPFLDFQTVALRLFQMKAEAKDIKTKNTSLIIVPKLERPRLDVGIRGFEVPSDVSEVTMSVSLVNLSAEAQSITLDFLTGGSQSLSHGDGPVTISPRASERVSISFPASNLSYNQEGRAMVEVRGRTGDGLEVSPAALFFIKPLGLREHMDRFQYVFPLPVGDLSRWTKNASSQMDIKTTSESNVVFDVRYGAGEKWIFPQFTIPQEVDLDRVSGVLVRARCTDGGTVRVMTWPDDSNNYSTTGYSIIKADGEWHVAYVPLESFLKPDGNLALGRQIKKISIGVSAEESAGNSLEISNLIFAGN